MDDSESGLGVGDISMIVSSGISDISDTPDDVEVSESTRLGPLTSSLNNKLTFEDNPLSNENSMGIENSWAETNSSTSDSVIPLPPPPINDDSFVDNSAYSLRTEGSIPYGPFLPATGFNNLFSDSGDAQDESVIGELPPAGVCGLHNLGNTCFMAAGLQCLTATPPVLQHFLDLQEQGEKHSPPGSLMAHFSSLLSQMWSGRFRVVRPIEFKQTLGAYHSQFKDYRQHDCQEFLTLLLDSLHEQLNLVKKSKNCNTSATSVPTANSITIHQNGETDSLDSIFNDTANSKLMESYDDTLSPNCPNSPDVTIAGSPAELDSPMGDFDSNVNSPRGSPLNDDEETLDSEEIVDTKSTFIHNMTHENGETSFAQKTLHLDNIYEWSKKNQQLCDVYCDIMKDAKTSNANFLVTQPECNNEIYFDSQKFPKENARRPILDNTNLTENHDFDNKSITIKRIKEVNIQKVNGNLDCGLSSGSETEFSDNGLEKCNVKRMRLEEQEKNRRRDGLGTSGLQCSRLLEKHENGAVISEDDIEADKHWAKHLRLNRSVIVDTFQGQFKSTVVCAVCKHISVTYEPFMYLSVPLPHAMERQLVVTYIPANGESPIRCAVSLNKESNVGRLKEEVLRTLNKENIPLSYIALVEVLDNHIAKSQEDITALKYVDATNRSIYAIELMDPPEAFIPEGEGGGGDRVAEMEVCQNGTSASEEIGACTICLEEHESGLNKHSVNPCSSIICDACMEPYFKSKMEYLKCPVCYAVVTRSSFSKIDQTGRTRPAVRVLNIPVVMRHDMNEATNNRKGTKLFGHPHLVRLPSRVNAKDLWECVRRIIPEEGEYTLLFVDGPGTRCSRCIFPAPCTGCEVPTSGMVHLQSWDTLAVRYTENVPKIPQAIDHISYSKHRPHHPLSLYDCLRAFSQSETLDELNPWFCPKCERNQCATKTLTVNRYPQFLIVYLKRFVFYECVSIKLDDKVTFPLVGLEVGDHRYDLYACVCHFGGVSAGHYTAYAKNPKTCTWHYYNDELTSKQKPQEEDYSNAYILFYSRQETNLKPCNI